MLERRLGVAALALFLCVAGALAVSARADDPVQPAAETSGDWDPAAPAPAAATDFPAWCRYHEEVVFYSRSWGRLAQFLAANPGPCADYYISVPARDTDKTQPRPDQAALIRSYGPHFHPLAEFGVEGATGWRAWLAKNPGKTWADAARLWIQRAVAAGYDWSKGDTWSVNDFGYDVPSGVGSDRAGMVELVQALHDATGTEGLVFQRGPDQLLADVSAYKAEVESWLQDDAFWSGLDGAVRWFAQDSYADTRAWGVAGAPRSVRAAYLNDYFEHLPTLAQADPRGDTVAADFLRRTYVPLMNAAWRYASTSGFGDTQVDRDTMATFVSEQVYANRHYAGSHPQLAPGGRVGFAYVQSQTQPIADSGAVLARLASAIAESYAEGGGSPTGACGPAGEHDWCGGADVAGAAFNDAWQSFEHWDG